MADLSDKPVRIKNPERAYTGSYKAGAERHSLRLSLAWNGIHGDAVGNHKEKRPRE